MDVLMPQLGETVAEGKITKWFKSAGDAVKPGDNLFEIETDKVSMEVPSITAGVLTEIRVPAGATAPVGAVVAVIAGEGGAARQRAAAAAPRRRAAPKASAARGRLRLPVQQHVIQHCAARLDPFFEVRTPDAQLTARRSSRAARSSTPLARRLAGERGIDLSRVSGLRPARPHRRRRRRERAAGGARPRRGAGDRRDRPSRSRRSIRASTFEEVPLDGMRAHHRARAWSRPSRPSRISISPPTSTIDALLKLREEANAGAPKGKDGEPAYKLSVNDFVIKALALALQRVPAANAVWAGDRILRFKHSDVGVAVAIDGGLLTPVIRNAEQKSLSAISNEMRDLAGRARDKKLKPAEYQGGATAISNLGMYGVREFSAIINPPHATILAVGAAQRRPVEAADGSVKFVSQMTVTLSCDHRVVDGALGARVAGGVPGADRKPGAHAGLSAAGGVSSTTLNESRNLRLSSAAGWKHML